MNYTTLPRFRNSDYSKERYTQFSRRKVATVISLEIPFEFMSQIPPKYPTTSEVVSEQWTSIIIAADVCNDTVKGCNLP